ncbi:type 1 glutamine amidotransferase domain-containing protein [Pararobbsia silviterrae]|uniref:Type 1 glutamine amidotransferase domain-containing protein n=1 Tax=Pararobbsia silviterrae TaxID=1792498 RepID=A0A494XUZ6_9BURK|nr:type 1 glutamine amidotransferase domain-containing protein [Pararobbsia silviterrae]RKP51889.1 type 1 glutamine amidotransferase domain-containing protein [Pararobbsia silviterrae]
MKPVLFVMTSHGTKGASGKPTGFYLSEVTHPLAVLDAAGIRVEFASIQGGEPPVDGLDLDDPINARYWNDASFRASIAQSKALADIDSSAYSAIFFAGGHGAMWDFPTSAAVNEKTREVWEAGGIVGAVCHGPAALVNVTLSDGTYLVKGRKVAAFTDSEEEAVGLTQIVPFLLSSTLAQRGAAMQPGADWTRAVSVDGHLVTGQNPQSATGVGEAIRDLLQ